MRVTIWLGLLIFALGLLLSKLANALIQTQATGTMQITATIIATILFLLISATTLGIGAGLILHWLIGYIKGLKAFIIELAIGIATFFVGIGTLFAGHWMTKIQLFFTFTTISITLFMLSLITLFGSITQGITVIKKTIKKRLK